MNDPLKAPDEPKSITERQLLAMTMAQINRDRANECRSDQPALRSLFQQNAMAFIEIAPHLADIRVIEALRDMVSDHNDLSEATLAFARQALAKVSL
jgi:hypothetical protein